VSDSGEKLLCGKGGWAHNSITIDLIPQWMIVQLQDATSLGQNWASCTYSLSAAKGAIQEEKVRSAWMGGLLDALLGVRRSRTGEEPGKTWGSGAEISKQKTKD